MPTNIIIEDMVFALSDAPPPADFAHVWLNNRRYQRLRTRMGSWLDRQPEAPSLADFQSELNRQAESFVFTDEAATDAVEAEAIVLAEDVIRQKLAASGYPEPKNLRDHALQLLAADPSFHTRAKQRIEAKALAASRMLSTLTTD